MKPIALALSLICVPKLFISLLFWPMVIGLFIAITQAITSSAYFGLVGETANDYQSRVMSDSFENRWLREKLFNTSKQLPPLKICLWTEGAALPGCEIEPFDVVVRNSNPTKSEIEDLRKFFDGSTRKIHFCESCDSAIVLEGSGPDKRSNVHGISALAVYMLTDSKSRAQVSTHYVKAKKTVEHLKDVSGIVYLYPAGLTRPINISQATKIMILVINTSLITIIALWLSLKGHRKVLDYFARNGALLPLVAACGKETFYTSLWIITLLRVAFFLIAVLPATIVVYAKTIPDETLEVFVRGPLEFLLYLAGLITSLSCLTIIASIAELKTRHCWMSFLYRYVPFALCILGTALWFVSVFTPGETAKLFQGVITCLPIIGISPILASPLFEVDSGFVAAHFLLSSVMVLLIFRSNSLWFAAHLEEL